VPKVVVSMTDRGELEALAYVIDALRQQEIRYRKSNLPVPASVPRLVEEVGFRVSRGQGGSPVAAESPAPQTEVETRLMVRYETAAGMLEVSMSTLKRLIKDGAVKPVRVGGTPRIRVADLEAFVISLPSKDEENVA
jgi:excisionase family DNA binding protein